MGSLVAGWDSPILDEHTARDQRNKSLTKEEINSFWKSKSPRENNERGMNFSPNGSSVDSPQFLNDNERRRAATPFSRSHNDVESIVDPHSVPNSPRTYKSTDEIADKSNMSRAWWTRSNSAFLNEVPPLDEMHGVAPNYTAQFNVTRLATGSLDADNQIALDNTAHWLPTDLQATPLRVWDPTDTQLVPYQGDQHEVRVGAAEPSDN